MIGKEVDSSRSQVKWCGSVSNQKINKQQLPSYKISKVPYLPHFHLKTERRRQTSQYKCNLKLRRFSKTIFVEKINIEYSGCVALVIDYAKHMRRIILSFVAPLALPHFSTLSHKRHYFRKEKH